MSDFDHHICVLNTVGIKFTAFDYGITLFITEGKVNFDVEFKSFSLGVAK